MKEGIYPKCCFYSTFSKIDDLTIFIYIPTCILIEKRQCDLNLFVI